MSKINKISIIIPCYNAEKFLENTIKSVLNQTYKNFNLYLVDNGSKDKSLSIMKKYKFKDERIFIVKNKKKTPKGKSINNLLKKINTKWVSILDADDLYFKNKIKEQVNFLQKNNKVKHLSCLAAYTLDGKKTFAMTNNPFKNLNSCFEIIKRGKNIGLAATGVIFDKNIVLKIGGIRYKYWPSDDLDLSNRIAESGHIVYSIPKTLMMYRMSDNSSMATLTSFIDGKKKAGWVKHSLIQRNNFKKEISFRKYLKTERNKNIFSSASNFFEDCSDYFYRQTIVHILNKNFILIVLYLLSSFFCNPLRFFSRVTKRIYNTSKIYEI